MCPFLSRCNSMVNPASTVIDLGCTASRSWAEINDQFGEPLGSYRRTDRFRLNCCHLQLPGSEMEEDEPQCQDHARDATTILDISFRKQRESKVLLEDLYRKVLIQNTTKTVQQEVMNSILQSIF